MGEHKLDRFYSLQEYMLLEQADPDTRCEYSEIHTYYHLNDEVYFQSLDISIPMNRIYEWVSIL